MFKKMVCLLDCLFLGFGCGGVHTKSAGQITLAPAAVKTVCDPAKPYMAVLVQPLEAQLASKGYRVVATPEEASYTVGLRLAAFGLNAGRPSTDSGPGASGNGSSAGSAPAVLSTTGTVIGGAASGSALHAARTTGGAVGGLAGLVLGSLLGSNPDHRNELRYLHVPFNGEVDVSIIESSSERQQAAVLAAWKQVKKEAQASAAREEVVNKLAAQIASSMP
jgi:hypothetical protein